MKLKSVLLFLCFSLCSNLFAANLHIHPKADEKTAAPGIQAAKDAMNYPGYCQIEIINDTYSDLRVFGTFDDNSPLFFNIYRYDPPHYVNLFYYSYCHSGMYLTIQNQYYTVFSGWVNVDSTVRIIPYLKNQAKVDIQAK